MGVQESRGDDGMNVKRRERTSNSEDAMEVMLATRKMDTKTTTAEVDVDAATKDHEMQKVKGDISTPPSLDAPTLSMDVASAGNSAAGGKGTSTDASLVTQREMKTKLKAPPKATVAKSIKKARDLKAKQSTFGTDNFDPYLVGGAVEGLREASIARGDGMITVCGLSHTKATCPSTAPSLKKTRKPPPSPMKVNSQGGQVQDASSKVRCKGN
jgi:hypothetical protein